MAVRRGLRPLARCEERCFQTAKTVINNSGVGHRLRFETETEIVVAETCGDAILALREP